VCGDELVLVAQQPVDLSHLLVHLLNLLVEGALEVARTVPELGLLLHRRLTVVAWERGEGVSARGALAAAAVAAGRRG
jgi:hypothetical protein